MKRSFFLILFLTLILITGCTSPEEKIARTIDQAVELREAGEASEALEKLETLAEKFPDDPGILRQIGLTYGALNDPTNAAFFLQQAHLLNPEDTGLLRETYLAFRDAGDASTAAAMLQTLSVEDPGSLDAGEWFAVGRGLARKKETQAALDAYLQGVSLLEDEADSETALAIGSLFIRIDNMAQAERWLKTAAESGDSNALPALLGLLEIHLRAKKWAEAEATIAALDESFPGALDASEWAGARKELAKWRAAQKAMAEKLAKAEAEKAAATAAEPAGEGASAEGEEPASEAPSDKAAALAEMDTAEALANTPAVEVEETEAPEAAADAGGPEIAFDPNIAVEPAEPETGIEVSFDGQAGAAGVNYRVESGDAAPTGSGTPDVPDTLDALVDEANRAMLNRELKKAVGLYWQAIGKANDRADLWNLLSRAYLADGQLDNAETTALESVRLSPGTVDYTLDYLRVIQRSKNAADFLAELEAAQARFPRSPEITLSLARAYERLTDDRANALILYRNFIELAPGHPLRPEAEEAVRRLR